MSGPPAFSRRAAWFVLCLWLAVLGFAVVATSSHAGTPCPLSAAKPHRCVKALPPDPRLFCAGRGTELVCVYLPRWAVRHRD